MRNFWTLSVTAPDRPFTLAARVLVHDSGDLNIVVVGGHDHTGAVALVVPRPDRPDSGGWRTDSSVLTVPGHRDDLPAREIGERVAAATGRRVVAAVGIHYDGLLAADLEVLRKMWRTLAEKIIEKLGDC